MRLNNPSIINMARVWRMAAVPAIVLVAIASMVYGIVPAASAAQSNVGLAGLNCASNPEAVEVKNSGSEDQDLTGWKLESDPSETFDLTSAGTLPAGASIFIESGPGAQATFTWSQSQIFRDNDPTDYARLVDNAGQTKTQIACAQPTPTPTAPPAPAPTPTPGPGQVPNGGGPPGAPDEFISPLTLIYAGGSVIGATAGIGLSWLGISLSLEKRRTRGRRTVQAAAETALERVVLAPESVLPPRGTHGGRGAEASAQPLLLAIIVAIAAAVLVAFLLQSEDSSRRK